jgi:hypothetical protein
VVSAGAFFARLDRAGMLVRKRFSMRTPAQVTGYAVALPGDTAKGGGPVWYGGGKLAADLTWPKLRHRWTQPTTAPGDLLTAAERTAIWAHAARTADQAAARIRLLAGADPAAAADAAWAASDTLHVAAAALGSRILRHAADAHDRAARAPHGRLPPPSPAGNRLRHAARLIAAFASLSNDPALTPLVLVARLAALAEAVADLRDAQRRAAQAAAARATAGHLHAAAAASAPRPPAPSRARTAAQLAALAFPPTPPGQRPAPTQPGPSHAGQRPTQGPSPPRSRGPHR